METFIFDSEGERRLAARIESLSEQIADISSKLAETAEGIAGCWKSDNSASYVEKCSILGENISETAQDLSRIGEDAKAAEKKIRTGAAAEDTGVSRSEKR